MKAVLFSFRRLLASPVFLLFFLLTLLLPPAACRLGKELEPAPAGVYLPEEADEEAAALKAVLLREGFLSCKTPEELREQVAQGRLDAGILIPAKLEAAFISGNIDGVLTLVKSPSSLLPDLWQEQAAAALYSLYAPYITADCLKDLGIGREEVLETYRRRLAEGDLFQLELSTREGTYLPSRERSRNLFKGTLALLLFTGLYFALLAPLTKECRELSQRITAGKAFRSFFLPGCLLRFLLLEAAAAAACCLSGLPELLLPLLGFDLLLFSLEALLTLLPGESWQSLLILLLAGLSLPLCPMYTDLALEFAWVPGLRHFLPCAWLWSLAADPLPGLLGIPAFGITIMLFRLKFGNFGRMSQIIHKSC